MSTAAEVAMSGTIAVHDSSGNVFEDLGVSNPEERLAKAELARAVRALIKERGVAQAEAAQLLGITPSEVVDLIRGRLFRFSKERLAQFLESL
jgi:predicted XRE-type DNA-binding protein